MNTDDWLTLITVLGLGSMGLLICAAFVGIIMSSRTVKNFPALKGKAFSLHQWGTIIIGSCILLHSFLSLTTTERTKIILANLLVPFTAAKETVWLGLGSIALYLIIITITLSLTVRKENQKLWRILHYGTYIALALALVHGLFISSTFKPDWKMDYLDAEKATVEIFGFLFIAAMVYRIRLTLRSSGTAQKRAAP